MVQKKAIRQLFGPLEFLNHSLPRVGALIWTTGIPKPQFALRTPIKERFILAEHSGMGPCYQECPCKVNAEEHVFQKGGG